MALSLAAFDTEDLAVISAHLQDARLTLSDVIYLRKRMRFVMVFHRKCREAPPDIDGRCHSGLHFERVLSASHIGFDLSQKERVLDLLAITFEPTTAPAGNPWRSCMAATESSIGISKPSRRIRMRFDGR